ncbi:unnamed protein product [Schistosoma rodhaini]|uniref:RNA-binding protein n=1 Tax=Schistosoma rodhaini TaxID=6188 RepID=A0A183QTC1_9TREM|nr:unnamed protein product [Schistosoma rodhaini]
MGSGSSILSPGINIHGKITKRLFENSKLIPYQSCQSSKQFTCNPEGNINDINDGKSVHSIDQTITNYKVESFYYDEDYLDKIEDDDNEEDIINNKTQSFKLEQNKLKVDNTVEGEEHYNTLNNNDNLYEHKEETDHNPFLQPDKQCYESLKDNISENSIRTILNDLNTSCTIEYLKSLEYPKLLQNDLSLSITSMNSLCTQTTSNNNGQRNDKQKFQIQPNTTYIGNSVDCLTSSMDKSEIDSILVIQSSNINNKQLKSNFTPLIDNVQSYLNLLKHNMYVQCNMNSEHVDKLCYQENVVDDLDKSFNIKLNGSKWETIKNENQYDDVMKLSKQIPIVSMNSCQIMDCTKPNTTSCSEIDHDNEEYLSLNDYQFDQIYHEKFQLKSNYDPFGLDEEYNKPDSINHRNLVDISLPNNNEYEIQSVTHELNSQSEEPISVDICKEGYIYTPIVIEKIDSSTMNTIETIHSVQTDKKCIKTTESYLTEQVLMRKDTDEIEMNEDNNVLDNYEKSILVNNEHSNQSTITKIINECTVEFHRPIYVQVVNSLHND